MHATIVHVLMVLHVHQLMEIINVHVLNSIQELTVKYVIFWKKYIF